MKLTVTEVRRLGDRRPRRTERSEAEHQKFLRKPLSFATDRSGTDSRVKVAQAVQRISTGLGHLPARHVERVRQGIKSTDELDQFEKTCHKALNARIVK